MTYQGRVRASINYTQPDRFARGLGLRQAWGSPQSHARGGGFFFNPVHNILAQFNDG